MPKNFKCADVICDFCGYFAQVKAESVKNINIIPNKILGAAWAPQMERMNAGIYFPLFIVVLVINKSKFSIFYLSADLQMPNMFVPRKPLSSKAKRVGWQGFYYDMLQVPKGGVARLV